MRITAMGGRAGAAIAGFLLAAAGSLAATGAVAEPGVRVLLVQTEAPVRVQIGDSHFTLRAVGTGIEANGRAIGPLWRPSGEAAGGVVDGVRVHGSVSARREGETVQVINRVGLEAYVAGTLGREVYVNWHPEMLKAQAVVVRTYVLYQMDRNREFPFDVASDTSHQVYGGSDAETASVRSAARATRGKYLSYGRKPILAAFHSASGGQTATAEEVWGEAVPYLQSIAVPDEQDSPDTYWRASVSRTTLRRALAPAGIRVGSIEKVAVSKRSASGRALRVEIAGSRGKQEMEARALRDALGLSVIRSTLFEIRSSGDDIVFVGSGHGHGVGMSQWGAQAMARSGMGYREILDRFYPGTQIQEVEAR